MSELRLATKPLIIGFAGKKQSGKGTACQFLTDNAAALFPIIRRDFTRTAPKVRTFSMAGPLKRLCIDVLGLAPEQVYGTNDQKNSPTRYLWQSLPHYRQVVIDALEKKVIPEMARANGGNYSLLDWQINAVVERGAATWLAPESQLDKLIDQHVPWGHMTGREVIQQVGTGMFRAMHSGVWAEAGLREILASDVDVALIDDIRFPDEFHEVKKHGGAVYRTTRVLDPNDRHPSETSLDADVFDWKQFDGVLDTANMEQTRACYELTKMLYQDGRLVTTIRVCDRCSGLDPWELDYAACKKE